MLLKFFESETGFDIICCHCNQYKSRNLCTKANKLSFEQQNTFLLKDEAFNMSKDNNYYLCKSCHSQILKRPNHKDQKDMFQWSNFPESLLEKVKEVSKIDEVLYRNVTELDIDNPEILRKRYEKDALMLNKLESFILKLVIPFVRVTNCKRGKYLMVKGNLILISNDIEHSLSKILPSKQQLLPVSFKRKLEYKGSFIEEWIDVEKVKCYFQWFKEHNPLFKEITLNEDLIQQFQNESLEAAKDLETFASNGPQQEVVQPNLQNVLDEIYCSDEELVDDIMEMPSLKSTEMDQTSMFCNKYETDMNLPTVANKLASIIINFESNKQIKEAIEDWPNHLMSYFMFHSTSSDIC